MCTCPSVGVCVGVFVCTSARGGVRVGVCVAVPLSVGLCVCVCVSVHLSVSLSVAAKRKTLMLSLICCRGGFSHQKNLQKLAITSS